MSTLYNKLKNAGFQTKRPNQEREVNRIFAMASKEELKEEYELIKDKKSLLSKALRERVVLMVEAAPVGVAPAPVDSLPPSAAV